MIDSCIVRCEDNGKSITIPTNTNLRVLLNDVFPEENKEVIAAYVNNVYQSLNYVITEDVTVRYLRISEVEGRRIYVRTLLLVLFSAVRELYPNAVLRTNFSVSDGFFFT
ncbi:MAG: hypothetical protein RR363_05155, partial [Rikenellaceae bacterium]